MAFKINLSKPEEIVKEKKTENKCLFCERPRSDRIMMYKLNSSLYEEQLYACAICFRQMPDKTIQLDDNIIKLFKRLIKAVDDF